LRLLSNLSKRWPFQGVSEQGIVAFELAKMLDQ
jgi:hypothetical protein